MTEMTAESDLLKPMSDQVLRQSELIAMRTLSDQMKALGDNMRTFGSDLKEIRDKVITMEAVKLEAQLAKLEVELRREVDAMRLDQADQSKRLAALERQAAETGGAKKLATAFREWLPALLVLGAAALFYFRHAP